MLQNSDPAPTTAAETRVPTHALTEALASIDARRTREAFARVGTVTLAEGLQDTGVEATPAEVYAEIETLRLADAAQEQVKRHQRRLSQILKAEVVSAMLCFATLYGFRQTLYNPVWQEARQVQDFRTLVQGSAGLHPKYIIREVVVNTRSWGPNGETATTQGRGTDGPVYPSYLLPDGINVHLFGGLIGGGQEYGDFHPQFMPAETQYVKFVEAAPQEGAFFRDMVSVYYNGAAYRRGYVRKSDVLRMLNGHSFTFFPALVARPPYQISDIVPLTLSQRSIDDAHGLRGQSYPALYDIFTFPEGSRVPLDPHAWEQYQTPPGGS